MAFGITNDRRVAIKSPAKIIHSIYAGVTVVKEIVVIAAIAFPRFIMTKDTFTQSRLMYAEAGGCGCGINEPVIKETFSVIFYI